MRKRAGSVIIGNRATGPVRQIEFVSKQAACRELGITMKRLERIIDKCLPIEFEGAEFFIDEQLPIVGEAE